MQMSKKKTSRRRNFDKIWDKITFILYIIFISARSQWKKHEKYIQTIKHATNLDKCSTSHNYLCTYIIECQVFSQTRKVVLHKKIFVFNVNFSITSSLLHKLTRYRWEIFILLTRETLRRHVVTSWCDVMSHDVTKLTLLILASRYAIDKWFFIVLFIFWFLSSKMSPFLYLRAKAPPPLPPPLWNPKYINELYWRTRRNTVQTNSSRKRTPTNRHRWKVPDKTAHDNVT